MQSGACSAENGYLFHSGGAYQNEEEAASTSELCSTGQLVTP